MTDRIAFLTRIAERAPMLIGWLLALISTVTLYAVEYATIKNVQQQHEQRLKAAEAELKDVRQQITSIQLDVRESATILRIWQKEGVPNR